MAHVMHRDASERISPTRTRRQRGSSKRTPQGTTRVRRTHSDTPCEASGAAVTVERTSSIRVPRRVQYAVRSIRVAQREGAPAALTIVLADVQRGIAGMPVPPAAVRALSRVRYESAMITRVPPHVRDGAAGPHRTAAYDERAYCLTLRSPLHGDAGGGVVYDVVDELQVLQFLYDNGLTALYAIPHLVTHRLLPLRDEDRLAENTIAQRLAVTFGTSQEWYHAYRTFHAARLRDRLLMVYGGHVERALEALDGTVRGGLVPTCTEDAAIGPCYVSDWSPIAYCVCSLAHHRVVATYHIMKRILLGIEPIPCDERGAEHLDGDALMFLSDRTYRAVPWNTFRALALGRLTPDRG